MPLCIKQSGHLDRCHGSLTHSQTLKDSATQLLIKYRSGALVTQLLWVRHCHIGAGSNVGNATPVVIHPKVVTFLKGGLLAHLRGSEQCRPISNACD